MTWTRDSWRQKGSKDLQTSVQFISADYDSVEAKQSSNSVLLTEQHQSMNYLHTETESIKESSNEIRDLHAELNAQLIDSKCREMRDNLVFTNIGEVLETYSSVIMFVITEQVLTGFLATKLRLDPIKFERVHRIPKNHVPDRIGP